MNFLASTPRPAPEQAAAARARLAAGIEAEALACGARTGRPVLGRAVLDAIRAVPRHAFVPGLPFEVAHEDEALPIGHGQTISQPFVVALMTELADLGPGDSVLEVAAPSLEPTFSSEPAQPTATVVAARERARTRPLEMWLNMMAILGECCGNPLQHTPDHIVFGEGDRILSNS